jgi:hypothetical protein
VIRNDVREALKTQNQKLTDRVTEKIRRDGDGFGKYLKGLMKSDRSGASELRRRFREACRFLAFKIDDDSPELSFDFCGTVVERWGEHRERLFIGDIDPGNFCSKVIDECMKLYLTFAPTFANHRDLLRDAERSGRLTFVWGNDSKGQPIRIRVNSNSLMPRQRLGR